MADESETGTTPARRAKYVWYALPGILLLAIVVWILSKMGEQTSGATLTRIFVALVGIVLVAGVVMLVLRRRDEE